MKKTIIFNDDIDNEKVQLLIEKIEECIIENDIKLYFSTGGGFAFPTDILIEFLNENKEKIELIAHHQLFSNGFSLFFKFTGKKKILDGTVGGTHLISWEAEIRELRKKGKNFAKYQMKEFERNSIESIEFLKQLGIKRKDLKRINRGKDVFFDTDYLNKLLENNKK